MSAIGIDRATIRRLYVEQGMYVIPAAILTLVTLLVILVLIPGVRTGLEANGQLEQEKARLARLEEKLAGLQSLNATQLNERAEKAEKALPTTKDVGAFLIGLRLTAAKSGVAVVSVDLSPGQLEADTGAVGQAKGSIAKVVSGSETGGLLIEATVVGDIAGLGKFLTEVQQMVPVVRVTSFSFGEEGTGVQVKIKLEGQYWPAPTTLGEIEAVLLGMTPAEEAVYQKIVSWVGVAETASESADVTDVPLGNANLMR